MAGKYLAPELYDAALNVVKNGATEMYLCTSSPANRAAAIAAALATRTGLTSGSFTGPGAGDVSGRKLTKTAESGISVSVTGTVTHNALCSGTTLLAVTEVTNPQVLTIGNTTNAPAFDVEFPAVTQ